MQPRPFDPGHDLPAVAELISRTRAAGGLSHPGGIGWWLRDAGTKDDFAAFVWPGDGGIVGFALVDGTFVVLEQDDGGPAMLDQLDWLERHMRAAGRDALHTHVVDGDPMRQQLEERGYSKVGIEYELMADTANEPSVPALPAGFRFASLVDISDEAYIAGHRAAWSDTRPSPYRRELHEFVKSAPQFRADLVTVALAPDGTVASYCIGWLDERSRTLEIEPLGTHRDYRRVGLAHAVVKEVQRRAWANGAQHVMVWNNPDTNPAAYGLYTGADMVPRRTLVELAMPLAGRPPRR